jgi:hypothetical protein
MKWNFDCVLKWTPLLQIFSVRPKTLSNYGCGTFHGTKSSFMRIDLLHIEKCLSPPEGGVESSTQAWMPIYVSILRIPLIIWVWRATVEWYIERGKPKNSEKNLSQCHFLHDKSHIDWPGGANPGLRGERTVNWRPKPWHGPKHLFRTYFTVKDYVEGTTWNRD